MQHSEPTSTPGPRLPGDDGYAPGDAGYRNISIALFLAGVATFALLHTPQALLPELVAAFDIPVSQAPLSVSAGTLGLGVALLAAGPLSEVVGRTPVIKTSIVVASALGLACAFAWSWPTLLGLRLLEGITLAGLPAVATAYLGEEIHPAHRFRAIGLYVGGTGLGGMSGRLIAGPVGEWFGWRVAMGTLAVISLGCALAVLWLLPASKGFVPMPAGPRELWTRTVRVLRDPGLLGLYTVSGCLMGGFVAVYNAMGFRLEAPPYSLPLSVASMVFAVYVFGTVASSRAGRLADSRGHSPVAAAGVALTLVGLAMTLTRPLPLVILGLVLLTAGFFAAHGVGSAWTPARARRIGGSASQAASLYLFSYYLGASVFGGVAGTAWTRGRWPGVALVVGALWGIALMVALALGRLRPAKVVGKGAASPEWVAPAGGTEPPLTS